MKFDVRFYLVSLLFIIFDLEVAFLFPWAITLTKTGAFAFWSMMVFLGVLTIIDQKAKAPVLVSVIAGEQEHAQIEKQ